MAVRARPALFTAASILTGIALAIILLATLLVSPPIHDYATSTEAYENASTLDPDEAADRHGAILTYLLGFSDQIDHEMSEAERSHMDDVRRLLYGSLGVALVFLLASLGIVRRLKSTDGVSMLKLSRTAIITALALIVGAGLLALASSSFTGFFTTMHLILFPQGNWMFPDDSFLIETYPLAYFSALIPAAVVSAIAILGILLGALVLASRYRN